MLHTSCIHCTLYKIFSGGSGYDSESSYNRGSYDSSDTALFREIADDDEQEIRLRRKPYQERNPHLKSVSFDMPENLIGNQHKVHQ